MKIESINSSIFAVNGERYQKGDFVIDYRDKSVKIIQKDNGFLIGNGVNYTRWDLFTDNNGDRFATYEDFANYLGSVVLGSAVGQGPQGPQGVPGPVGPAGLTWRGAWLTATPYVKDDAVGYSGASYFCINATSGTTTPNLDAANWALLASQGANGVQGAQGVQGPIGNTGPQGPAGPAGNNGGVPYKVYTAYLEFVNETTITATVLENTIGDGSQDGINDIKWTYNSATQPKATMTAAPFTANKTLASNTIYSVNENLQGGRVNSSQVRFYSNSIITGLPSLSFVPFVFVEIKVYN